MGTSTSSDDEFSVFVLASDLGVDAHLFLSPSERGREADDPENWQDFPSYFSDEDFSDLDARDFFRLEGSDKSGNRIFRIVGKFFPATVVFYKIYIELPEGSFCILYMHTTVQKEDNSLGMTILRWIYEDLPTDRY